MIILLLFQDRTSIYNLAVCFEKGFGVEKDIKQVHKFLWVKWLAKSVNTMLSILLHVDNR